MLVMGTVAAVAIAGLVLGHLPRPLAPLPPRSGPALADAKAWGYQLQNVDARLIPDAIDVLVVDHSRDGTQGRALTAKDVAALQSRSDGRIRIVLSYLSIGEAETYRNYWDPKWSARPPHWLGPENRAWRGNYAVRFWEPDWQRLIFDPQARSEALGDRIARWMAGSFEPYLDRILDAGFDGVYLDRVDAFEKAADQRPQAKADMIAFVGALARYAKARRPGVLVVTQNGEALLEDAGYRKAIDGVAKEDLLYGENGDGVVNVPTDVRHAIAHLNRARADGLPVFAIEYLTDPELQRKAASDLRSPGYVPLFAERALSLPPVLPP